MTKIAFLGNSHSNMGRLAEKYNSLLGASELGTCAEIDCIGHHETLADEMSFDYDATPDYKIVEHKNKLLFMGKLQEIYLDYSSRSDEKNRVERYLKQYGNSDDFFIVYNVFERNTITYLKEQNFRLVHVLHNNPDSDRLNFLIPAELRGNEELAELATPLLEDFKQGDMCDTIITVSDFNNVASIVKELHRLFL
jgi:hypothetical protein